uniref:cAMP-dependent protein kinase catalytic subunit n=1 Tax=Globodera rostochiensis TaxID=31243 RepID=A0A914H1W6_GLORO
MWPNFEGVGHRANITFTTTRWPFLKILLQKAQKHSMVDLSINYCVDLKSVCNTIRGGSLDRIAVTTTSNSSSTSTEFADHKQHSGQSDVTMVLQPSPQNERNDTMDEALETTNFVYRPSCPPVLPTAAFDTLSEGDRADVYDEEDEQPEEEEEEEEEEDDDNDDDDEDEYEYVDEEEEEEEQEENEAVQQPGAISATINEDDNGEVKVVVELPPKKRTSIRRKKYSASRSPAPERVDGAQAELDAEVEISEVIALHYYRNPSVFVRNPSVLMRPQVLGRGVEGTHYAYSNGTRRHHPQPLLYVHQPSVMEDDEQPQLGDAPPPPSPRDDIAAHEDAEEYKMMKRWLDPLVTIGTGAFGRVQLCQHRRTGKYYALKSMYMPTIIERKQVEHVHQEKRILQNLAHPFIVRLWDTAKDRANLYMVMEFLPGGELFAYFRALRKFSSTVVKFYSAEIILALEYLHSKQIAYRDLKPENLMVSIHGHIKLTDFGFAKVIQNKSYTLCGTPSYLAPEVFERIGHNQCVDYWALGVLIYELMAGDQPFWGKCPEDVYEHIQETKENGLRFPRRTFSPHAKEIIQALLCIDPKQRLGCDQLKQHPWFSQYEWTELYNRNYKPPFMPTIYHDGDTGNFDSYQEVEHMAPAKQCELDLFDEW